ncbi:right-handed parallel beta-helix repeat-containing protein [Paenibacillus wulumuqiensis]|uniref:right-handed parallel beta-helix repeat-containing protein n=1 Tax=Paenibacillus wulumuqiensis TaxID=1567107 RepID=UPI000619A481|nr:right-handed parallel beta-helix repeat-containing protein [Paenibacillus wulumuqiensis]
MKKFQKIVSLTAVLTLSSTLAVPYAVAEQVSTQGTAALSSGAVTATGMNLYVATSGSDTNGDGSKDKPYATLDKARDVIRALNGKLPEHGITVWVKGGEYETSTLELTAQDSGTADKPIIYRTYPGEHVTLTNGVHVPASDWKPLNPEAAGRVHPDVYAGDLYELDMKQKNFKHIFHFRGGTSFTEQWGIVDLIANGERQPISQWPNPGESVNNHRKGWTTINGSADAKSFYYGEGGIPENDDTTNTLDLDGTNRSERWKKSLEAGHPLYLKGFWRTVWSPITSSVQEIDTNHHVITLKDIPAGGMGSKWSKAVVDYRNSTSASADTYKYQPSLTTPSSADDALHDVDTSSKSYTLYQQGGATTSVELKEELTEDSLLKTETADPSQETEDAKPVTLKSEPFTMQSDGASSPITYLGDQPSPVYYPGDNSTPTAVTPDVYKRSVKADVYAFSSEYKAKIRAPYRIGTGIEEWRAINYLDEIDQPGEWALDFKDHKLYYYPKGGKLQNLNMIIADNENPVIAFKDASYIQMLGFTIEGSMGNGIEIKNSNHITLAANTLRNLGNGGILDVRGSYNLFQSNDIYEVGGFGISINDAGNRKSLTAANSRVTNNHIHHVGELTHLEPILVRNSVGVTFDHNLMHDVPKDAVRYVYSNNLTFEYNEVHNTSLIEGDTGAFYTAQDWASYGNVLRYNFIHHNKRSNGFYSDGADSGDNYQYNIVQGSTKGILLNGHDNIAKNNLVVDSNMIQIDQRGNKKSHGVKSIFADQLREMNPSSSPWAQYGKQLQDKYGYDHKLWDSILDPSWHPEYPNGTKMTDNMLVNTPSVVVPKKGDTTIEGNDFINTVGEAGFYDYSKMDLRTDNKQILAKFPNLNEVFPQIGLKTDSYRTRVVTRAESGGLSNH